MKQQRPLVLASGSPRRKRYFEGLGLSFRIQTSNLPEVQLPQEEPLAYALRLAREKGEAVISQCEKEELIISADTIVSLSEHLLGKPESGEDVVRMLNLLSGKTHEVITAYMILDRLTGQKILRHASSKVTFKKLSSEMIRWYGTLSEPLDKAGAYSIQGQGTVLIESIQGSYNNIVGLPIEMLFEDLISHQWISW